MSTITRKKVRADAKLEHLNAEQREQLRFWFGENRTYSEIVRLIRDKFELGVGKSTVNTYWRRRMLPEQSRDDTQVAALAVLPAADFDAVTLRRAKALASASRWLAPTRMWTWRPSCSRSWAGRSGTRSP